MVILIKENNQVIGYRTLSDRHNNVIEINDMIEYEDHIIDIWMMESGYTGSIENGSIEILSEVIK